MELQLVSHCLLWLLDFSRFILGLLAVSHCLSGSMELLQDSHYLLLLLAVSNCLSSPIELLHVSHCLLWVVCCLSLSLKSLGVATCL